MTRILTDAEFAAFAAAEAALEERHYICWTDVRERSDSAVVAAMWDDAMTGVEMMLGEPGLETQADLDAECARRVAVAQHYLITGDVPQAVR